MNYTVAAILLSIGILLGALGEYVIHRVDAALNAVQQEHETLTRRIAELEASAAKRHTQSTQSAFHDALAIALDVLLEDQAESEYRLARIRQLQSVLKVGSSDPYAYPVDPPAGMRPRKCKPDVK